MASTVYSGSNTADMCPVVYASGLWWVFYKHGSTTDKHWYYKTSADGTTWGTEIDLGNLMSFFYACVDGDKLHIAGRVVEDYKVYYRMATLNSDGSLTWVAAMQTVYTYDASSNAGPWDIKVDANGYPMIAYLHGVSTYQHLTIDRSTTKNGTWTGIQIFNLDTLITPKGKILVTDLGEIYVAVGKYYSELVNQALQVYKWNGSTFDVVFTSTGYPYLMNITAKGGIVEVIYRRDDDNIYRATRQLNGYWDAEELIDSSIGTGLAYENVFACDNSEQRFIAWQKSDNHIYIKLNSEAKIDWQDETTNGFYNINSFSYFLANNQIGISWVVGSSPNYKVNFAIFTFYPNGHILELAFNQYWNTVSPTWTDVSSDLIAAKTHRGRMHSLGKIEAGTMDVTLNNASGNYWRNNTASIHYPYVKPITLIRLRYFYDNVEYPVWYGLTESFKPGWIQKRGGYNPIMDIACVDIFKALSRVNLVGFSGTTNGKTSVAPISNSSSGQKDVIVNTSGASDDPLALSKVFVGQSITIGDDDASEVNYIASIDVTTNTITMTTNLANTYDAHPYVKKFPKVLSGTRINDVLIEAQWPLALSDIDTGQMEIVELVPPSGGTNALDHILNVASSEDGVFFIARDGIATYQDSIARQISPLNTSQCIFSDK